MTVVAIHQPQYLPWVPYFDKMDQCDIFVYLDTVQYQKRGVQNRNQIKTPHGAQWLTIPVNASRKHRINEVTIASERWRKEHIQTIELNYRKTLHFSRFADADGLASILEQPWHALADLNIAVTNWLAHQLDIHCEVVRASKLDVGGSKGDLIVNICEAVGAKTYLSGQGARAYLQKEGFSRRNIALQYQVYAPQPYAQNFMQMQGFIGNLSAIDLVLNTGTRARETMLNGRRENELA